MGMQHFERILVVKMSSLGDVIHALPTLYALRKNLPHAHITWAVHKQFSYVLPKLPWIDDIIYVDKKKLKSLSYLKELCKELRARQFDMCLDLQCLAKSALVSWLSGAKVKYGYWELREGSFLVNKALVGPNQYGHVIERYLDTVRALGGEVDDIVFPFVEDEPSKLSLQALLRREGLPEGAPYVVIAPGARWNVKEWSPEKFGALMNRFMDQGLYVVLIGTKEDAHKGQRMEAVKVGERCINLIEKTTVLEMIELIRQCDLFIGADTGPLHIANALKRPLIGLYGVTEVKRSGPYGGSHIHVVVSPTSKTTLENPIVNDPTCMDAITVDAVWDVYVSMKGDTP